MVWGRGLDDAVSQVEHELPAAQGAQDAVCFGMERGTAGGQELGIEVALHAAAQAVLQLPRGPSEGNRGVQADAVRAGCLGEAVVAESGAPGEGDDGHGGVLVLAGQLERLRAVADVRVGGWGVTGQSPSADELVKLLDGTDVLAVAWESITAEVLDATSLRYIASVRGGPGANIDLAAAAAREIPVTGTIGREAIPVAEFAIGLMIGFFRSIPQTYHRLVTRELTSAEPPPPGDLGWGMEPNDPWLAYRGQDLAGKRLGLVGLGAVGKNVAKRAAAFDMTVTAYDPFVSSYPGVSLVPLEDVMTSDVVSVHARYGPQTHELVGAAEIARMPAHGLIVNTARPHLIARDALLAALRERRIAGAALDVHFKEPLDPDDEFLALPNVIVTPHIAGSTYGVTRVQSIQVVDNIIRFAAGDPLVNVVNFG
jgi:D-3-phosphoglycerate dehydrogenase